MLVSDRYIGNVASHISNNIILQNTTKIISENLTFIESESHNLNTIEVFAEVLL